MFTYLQNGVYVIAERNLSNIFVVYEEKTNIKLILESFGAAMAFHATEIRNTLNSFNGYNDLEIKMITTKDSLFLLSKDDIVNDGDFRIENDVLVEVPSIQINEIVGDEIVFRSIW